MNKTFRFDGVSSRTYGLTISGSGTYNAPERDVERIPVPGRDGELIQDNGRFKNVTVSYPASICRDFPKKAAAARAWLLSKRGYCRLEDDYDPDIFRLAQFSGPLEFTPGPLNRAGEVTLRFNCKPQRFLKAGEFPITVGNGDTLYNPTPFPAKPLILVTVKGALGDVYATFTIGAYTMTLCLMGNTTYYIDCEALDAYNVDASGYTWDSNSLLSCKKFPRLVPGETEVSWAPATDEIVEVRIIPRWWTV